MRAAVLRPWSGLALPGLGGPGGGAPMQREHDGAFRAEAPVRVDGPPRKKKARRERGGQGG
jgi:hypothetical protein